MRRTEPDKSTVLVTDATRGSAVSIIRSLGRRGWRVIAADCDRRAPGLRSRFAAAKVIYPNPETDPAAYAAALLEQVRQHAVDLIIPVTDAAILPLADRRAEFEKYCSLAMPHAEALEATTNKRRTLELAEQLAVPIPRTQWVDTAAEAGRYAQQCEFPVVVKPQTSRIYRDRSAIENFSVGYAENVEELVRRVAALDGRCPVLLQEYISGTGCGVELLMHEGRPLSAFQHRRLREIPVTGGVSSLRESVALDPVLYEYAVRLLGELNWTGLAMVEFKLGDEGPVLMEINGRIWGSLPLAVHSGMDFPAQLADLYVHGLPRGAVVPRTSYRLGVRARNLELDMVWIASVLFKRHQYPFLQTPKRSSALVALLGLLNPKCKSDIFSLGDLRPGLAELPKIVRHFHRALSRARTAAR